MAIKLLTRHTLLYATAFTFIGLTGCNPEEDLSPASDLSATSTQLMRGSNPNNVKMFSDRYVILGITEKLPAGLANQIQELGGELTSAMDEVGVATVTSTDPNFASKASKIAGIRSVVRDLEIEWFNSDNIKTVELSNAVANISNTENATSSYDRNPYYYMQWGHTAINAPAAWNKGAKGKGVRVAVLDTGFNFNHPDLKNNIDVAASFNFVPGEQLQYRGEGSGHGTHVAGTVAAIDDNVGVIGVAPEATLILVKVMNEAGSGAFSWIMQGIVHAVHQNANVINMSLGAAIPHNSKYTLADGTVVNETKAIQEILVAMSRVTNYAHRNGVTVISSAGNNANDGNADRSMVYVPAHSSNVISISATGPTDWAYNQNTNLDVPSSYTNYGTSDVTFAAPGGDFVSPRELWYYDMVLSTTVTGWGWMAGTSMAAPHAAGIAALIIGQNGGKMAPAQVLAKMRATADDLGKPGRDPFYGYGRLNASRAVTQ